MKSAAIREKFLSFFEKKGHARVASSPLVPAGDPTLLFTNSGMVQFKDVFLGFDKRPYKTAATAQRCLRAGGKHNDLQNVGYTARHHTFFEMLGNFSFGEYFKERAVPLAWEFLTSPEWLGIDKKHLWITVFGGGKIFGDNSAAVPPDEDAFGFWKQELMRAGFSEAEAENRITRIPTTDNFWMMGDTGPCGPCSEIFYDRDINAKSFRGENEKHADECVEIWNLVFMEYNRGASGELKKLPAPCVDTGMGLERISAVMQNKKSNYDIDMFCDILAEVENIVRSGGGVTPSHRVIADHIRAAAYLIADGVLPDNEGRGYVLRKIIRRALIHGAKAANTPNMNASQWFVRLVDPLAKIMDKEGAVLREKRGEIVAVLKQEERGFHHNFMHGQAHLAKKIKLAIAVPEFPESKGKIPIRRDGANHEFPGDIAFELYDTYGFPVEATLDEVLSRGFSGIDMQEYEKCMAEQRARSRAAMKFNAGQNAVEYGGEATEFVGYENLTGEAEICAIFAGGESKQEARAGEEVLIVLNRTPFYAESGGQIGDAGILRAQTGAAAVLDAQKIRADVWGHAAKISDGAIKTGGRVECEVDAARRQKIACNHSATHLLHAALRKVLGTHVQQKGSMVAADYLRFDFSHGGAMSDNELREVEDIVNAQIRENAEVQTESMPHKDAMRRGAMALFGEKYGDIVRVVSINAPFSVELCGGTHAARTGGIGFFQIVAEGAVAAGVRRIEAATGAAAVARAQNSAARLREISEMLKTPPEKTTEKILQLRGELKDAQKQTAAMQSAQTAAQTKQLISQAETAGGMQCLIAKIDGADGKALREMISMLRGKLPEALLFLAGDGGGRASFAAHAGASSIAAKEWMNAAAQIANAKGGGKADYAQAGGGDVGKIGAALKAAREFVETAKK